MGRVKYTDSELEEMYTYLKEHISFFIDVNNGHVYEINSFEKFKKALERDNYVSSFLTVQAILIPFKKIPLVYVGSTYNQQLVYNYRLVLGK